MNKYIKLEDAIRNINLEVTGRKEHTGDMKANLFFALDDLPTIEVSEDCISREGIIKALRLEYPSMPLFREMREGWHLKTEGYHKAEEIIRNAPSVVPTTEQTSIVGEWVEREDYNGDNYYDCSICSESFVFIDGTPSMNLYHYCPNCGAKMKGADNYE